MLKKICVFCGSNSGHDDNYYRQIVELGKYIQQKDSCLVYGGGKLGMMGELYQTVHKNGNQVIGIIPEVLKHEAIEPAENTDLILVKDMSERKQKMVELADVFVVFPGGIGTMEEFFQVYSWNQLGIAKQPIVLVNIDGYYDKLIDFIKVTIDHGFVPKGNLDNLIVEPDVDKGLERAENYHYEKVNKWE